MASYDELVVLENTLRHFGFWQPTEEGTPICRWAHADIILDLMPTDLSILGFSNRWYRPSFENSQTVHMGSLEIRLITAPYFLATKLEAFHGRGRNDYRTSRDLEDIVAILDGRSEIVEEVAHADIDLRQYLGDQFSALLGNRDFVAAVPGYLLPDAVSQERMQIVIDRIRRIAASRMTNVSSGIRNLVKVFSLGESVFGTPLKGEVRAVDDVSLDIVAGETLGLVGESGSGKSTLGRLVLRLIEPTSGSVKFEGRDLTSVSAAEMRRLRSDLQFIFQDPFGSLDPRFRVEDVIAEPLIIHERMSVDVRRTRVSELLRAVGLDDSAMRRFPHEFSGGQRQRVGIARALALRPKFIVADEPVSALDVSVGAQIVNLLAQLQREFGLTYLFISHSMPVVRYLSTRIAVMQRGKIVEIGTTEQITEQPRHPYTQALLRATPEIAV